VWVIGFGLVLSSVVVDRLLRRPAICIVKALESATPTCRERADTSRARPQASHIVHLLGSKAS
jgi:hypothetical protein